MPHNPLRVTDLAKALKAKTMLSAAIPEREAVLDSQDVEGETVYFVGLKARPGDADNPELAARYGETQKKIREEADVQILDLGELL